MMLNSILEQNLEISKLFNDTYTWDMVFITSKPSIARDGTMRGCFNFSDGRSSRSMKLMSERRMEVSKTITAGRIVVLTAFLGDVEYSGVRDFSALI